MNAYEIIKKCLSIAQKADNIELVKSLIEAQSQILELQNENSNLRSSISKMEDSNKLSKEIERHTEPFITLKENYEIKYCAHCWDYEQKLIQLDCVSGKFTCPHCKYEGYYDRAVANKIQFNNLKALM